MSSWNIEFSHVYNQYSLESVNDLESCVLELLKWDVFISGVTFAKYYFALRSLNERKNFRQRYNYVMRMNPPNSQKIEQQSADACDLLYSKSM